MRRSFVIFILLAVVLLITGCFKVKDTKGVALYLSQQGKCEMLALEIKGKFQKGSQQYADAEKLFNEAAADCNGWVASEILEIEGNATVNITEEEVIGSHSYNSMNSFLSFSPDGKGSLIVSALAQEILDFGTKIVNFIIELNQKRTDEAIKKIKQELEKTRWPTFAMVDEHWYKHKYGIPHEH